MGGAYFGLDSSADLDIDWHAEGPNDQPYRPATGLSAGKINWHAEGQTHRSFEVTANYALGWNQGGDWYNYTRNWPSPAADCNVIGRLSSGGAPIGIELDLVTSDPSQLCPGYILQ